MAVLVPPRMQAVGIPPNPISVEAYKKTLAFWCANLALGKAWTATGMQHSHVYAEHPEPGHVSCCDRG